MRRRICLIGIAMSAIPLALGITAATTAAKRKTTKKTTTTKTVSVTCTTNVAIMIPAGQTGVTPPVGKGTEYGPASCGKLGHATQTDRFTVPDSGDTVGTFTWLFTTGSLHGTYDLTPQEGSLNFDQTDYLGSLTVVSGTGTMKGTKGTGTMTCTSLDGIHTSCMDKVKLTVPVVTP